MFCLHDKFLGRISKSCIFCSFVRGVQSVIRIEARSSTPAIGYLDFSKVGRQVRVAFPRNLDARNYICIMSGIQG
jgi:hypothetical protein